jgi:hypothetical protein
MTELDSITILTVVAVVLAYIEKTSPEFKLIRLLQVTSIGLPVPEASTLSTVFTVPLTAKLNAIIALLSNVELRLK